MKIIFETVKMHHKHIINKYIKSGTDVSIVEPFHTFHHTKGNRFYPPPLPDFANDLIKKKVIKLIKTEQFSLKEIYQLASDKAVKTVESVYDEYKTKHKELFEYICKTLNSINAEKLFKKNLCEKLAEFYSVNILLHRIKKLIPPGLILVYIDTNVRDYHYLKALLSKSKQGFFDHSDIKFPAQLHVSAFIENLKEYFVSISRLATQTLASGLIGSFRSNKNINKKRYSYGIAIVSPLRQLTSSRRGPDFIIDNNKIRAEDVVYLPLMDLTVSQKEVLERLPGDVFYPPRINRCFSHFSEWKNLLGLVFRKNLFFRANEINTACSALISYFRWKKVLESVELKHLITHCDFGINHIGRNLALDQAGIETWYFTDSMNFGCNLRSVNGELDMQHPFWTYLNYDHFVTWDDFLAQYFGTHPGSFKQKHIIGCLWSEHIQKAAEERAGEKNLRDGFVIAAFDSTFSRSGFTSYSEGVAFAGHILQLADDFPDIHIFFKEKKPRDMHYILDPEHGPALLDLYKRMDEHSRITTCYADEDSSELISLSDMVVSFPFTSTTFEALSINKAAVWHDPLGYYMNTPYAKAGGVTTHSYDELKKKIEEIKHMEPAAYRNPFPKDSPLMDPYRDGKAIDRFRELLSSRNGHIN